MDRWRYKPAADIGLPPLQSLASLRRESGLGALAGQCLWSGLSLAYFRIVHRLCITGVKNLPATAPFVLVANHSSHLDAPALACALPLPLRLRAFPIAAGDTFFTKPVTAWFAAALLNALPMWRKKCGPHALDVLRERLMADPAIFLLFPEGTRTRDGKMGDFKSGIGRLVARTSIPVVPCQITGCFEALPPGKRLPRIGKIAIRIGCPLVFADVPDTREGWDQVAFRLRSAIEEESRS